MQVTTEEISTTTEKDPGEIERIVEKLTNISLVSQCFSTTQALGKNGCTCWGCLVKTYEGMVALDSFRSEKKSFTSRYSPRRFYLLRRRARAGGDIRESTECNLKPIHSINLAPPENAFGWMERKRPENSQSHSSTESPGCFLVRQSPNPKCLQCSSKGSGMGAVTSHILGRTIHTLGSC